MSKRVIATVLVILFTLISFAPVGAATKKVTKKQPVKSKKVAAIAVAAPKYKIVTVKDVLMQEYTKQSLRANDVLSLYNNQVVTVRTQTSQGSGFIFKDYGRVITNSHVISGAKWATVTTWDGIPHYATVVSDKPDIDLAVLSFADEKQVYCPMTDRQLSADIKVGDKVVAIGTPEGLENTVTTGEVNAIRTINGIKLIQHTARVWGGNSGGPLFNTYGQVIGINSYTSTENPDISFSIVMDYLE